MERDFHLAPPVSATVSVYDWAQDTNGNPASHFLIMWDNGQKGDRHEGGRYATRRRVQTGYADASEGALLKLPELFPGTSWRISGNVTGSRAAGQASFTVERDRNAESAIVIFRADKESGDPVAFFPCEAWNWDGSHVASYVEIGEHGGASPDYYRDNTRPADAEQAALLRKLLEGRGYVLDVRKRWTPAMDEKRAALLAASRQFEQAEAI